MERTLLIIRHGKSSWDNEDIEDIDRPLAPRGTRNAGEMARWIADHDLVPELIFSSPANRARTTAGIMAETWALDPAALQIHETLYMAYLDEIRAVVAKAPSQTRSLAIFGHNPSFTLYANTFLKEALDNLPTAGLVMLRLESDDWSDLGAGQVRGSRVVLPRKHL